MQLSFGNPRMWWIAILVGSALLTLALVVLARLRWIQSRPFATCVALSVFAHILLIATVLLSRVFDEVPRPPGAAPMRITILPSSDPPTPVASQPQQPWQRLASEVPPVPELDDPPRQAADLTPRAPQAPAELPELVEDDVPLPDAPKTVEPLPLPTPAPSASVDSDARPAAPAPALLDVVATPLVSPTEELPAEEPPDEEFPDDEVASPEQPVDADSMDKAPDPQVAVDQVATEPDGVEVEEPAPLAGSESLEGTGVESPEVANSQADSASGDVADVARGGDSPPSQPLADSPPSGDRPSDDRPPDGEEWTSIGADQLFPVAPANENPFSDNLTHNGQLPWRAAEDGNRVSTNVTPEREASPARMPREFQLRVRQDRLQAARSRGANERTERAVKASLYWLAQNQANDGRWDPGAHGAGRGLGVDPQSQAGAGREADTGITGLALLAFLGAGHTHLDGKHKPVVQHGLEYLLRQQAVDGNLAGRAGAYDRMYCHGMATLALGEAVAMTGDRRLEPFLRRAIEYTVRSQHPTTGGWRYRPGDRGDTSQLGWQLMCVTTAESGGVAVPVTTRRGMEHFLASVSYGRGGLAAYRVGEAPTRSMTAEALVCRLFLEKPPAPAAVEEAVGFIMQETPGQGQVNYYYWYYGTLALSLLDDEDWPVWNRDLQAQLLARQRLDDPHSGSWDPDSRWGAYGGRVFTTALATLCLEVYYRYQPVEQDGLARRRQSATGRR